MNLLRIRRAAVAALAATAVLGVAGVAGAAPSAAGEAPARAATEGPDRAPHKAPGQAAETLREAAASSGRFVGTAIADHKLDGSTYAGIAGSEFNSATPENAMKWESVEPERGQYNWAGADRVVDFAESHDQQVHGHTLVWHSQLPDWLENGSFSESELRTIMTDHIETEAGRYEGRIDRWDVVNEAFNEDGTFRESKFYTTLGEGYIAEAFRAARAADPGAELYINDYNTDGIGAKSDGMYNLVKKLKQQGVPVDGVGFQSHLVLGQVPSTMQANLQRFADLGVDVAITELDIRMDLPATESKLQQQARDYKAVANACLTVERCEGITVWAFSDADSWVPDVFEGQGAALPYDENYQPKPAYYALLDAFGAAAGDGGGDSGSCTAAFGVQNQWSTGSVVNVGITPASSMSTWKAEFDLPSGVTVRNGWNGVFQQSGTHVTVTDAGYNGTVAGGKQVSFGFQTEGVADPGAEITLNGEVCAAG